MLWCGYCLVSFVIKSKGCKSHIGNSGSLCFIVKFQGKQRVKKNVYLVKDNFDSFKYPILIVKQSRVLNSGQK